MGIRFTCPNGHHLNVKSFLAGKRGICPECNVRFIVPQDSGGVAAMAGEAAADASASIVIAQPPTEPSPAEPPPPTEPALPQTWYVRLANGQQFGPADEQAFQSWVAEGRVAADSWVWCTGWPDWKRGSEVVDTSPGGSSPAVDPVQSSAVVRARPARRRRSPRHERAKKLSLVLAAVVFLLLLILVIVVSG